MGILFYGYVLDEVRTINDWWKLCGPSVFASLARPSVGRGVLTPAHVGVVVRFGSLRVAFDAAPPMVDKLLGGLTSSPFGFS